MLRIRRASSGCPNWSKTPVRSSRISRNESCSSRTVTDITTTFQCCGLFGFVLPGNLTGYSLAKLEQVASRSCADARLGLLPWSDLHKSTLYQRRLRFLRFFLALRSRSHLSKASNSARTVSELGLRGLGINLSPNQPVQNIKRISCIVLKLVACRTRLRHFKPDHRTQPRVVNLAKHGRKAILSLCKTGFPLDIVAPMASLKLVLSVGLEPTRLAASGSKPETSTSSATTA